MFIPRSGTCRDLPGAGSWSWVVAEHSQNTHGPGGCSRRDPPKNTEMQQQLRGSCPCQALGCAERSREVEMMGRV